MAQHPDSHGRGGGEAAAVETLAQDLKRAQADCLELLESNRRLREAGHRKDDLLALCAHDLRQPLNVLLGQARLLLSGARGPLADSHRAGLEAIERQGRRLLEMADDLAGLGSLEVGRLGVEREAVDLGALCNEVADGMAPALRDKGGALTRTLPAYPLVLRVDVEKLRRALTLLFSQAILLAPRGGRIDLSLEPLPEGARISVTLGVAEGAARARRPRTRTGPASELGLAICRELVELNGGTLETEPAEGGLCFSVVLPLSAEDAGPARPAAGAQGRSRLLVVEDEADQRDALAELLGLDYQVATARDGEEGVRVARADPPDVIVMDLVMPAWTGSRRWRRCAAITAPPRSR